MFILSKIAWKRIESETSIPKYFREGITNLMLPYKIDLNLFETNMHCFLSGSTYSSKTGKQCTDSLVNILNERYNLPLGYPDWFYAAFPDVANWLMTKQGVKMIKDLYGDSDDIVDSDTHKIKINILSRLVKVYKERIKNTLELSD